MCMNTLKTLLLLSVAVTAPVAAHAQATAIATATAPAPTIAGEWNASMNTPGGARAFGLVFKVDGEQLSGTVKRDAGDVPLEGTVKGKTVTFSYSVNYNGNALMLTMTATVSGDTMKGTVSFGGQADDEFSATRTVKTP